MREINSARLTMRERKRIAEATAGRYRKDDALVGNIVYVEDGNIVVYIHHMLRESMRLSLSYSSTCLVS